MFAAGGDYVSDPDASRAHTGVYGQAASNATITRLFDRINRADEEFDHGMTTLSRGGFARACGPPPGSLRGVAQRTFSCFALTS